MVTDQLYTTLYQSVRIHWLLLMFSVFVGSFFKLILVFENTIKIQKEIHLILILAGFK